MVLTHKEEVPLFQEDIFVVISQKFVYFNHHIGKKVDLGFDILLIFSRLNFGKEFNSIYIQQIQPEFNRIIQVV